MTTVDDFARVIELARLVYQVDASDGSGHLVDPDHMRIDVCPPGVVDLRHWQEEIAARAAVGLPPCDGRRSVVDVEVQDTLTSRLVEMAIVYRVRFLAQRRADGSFAWRASDVRAIDAPWSETRGTEYTAERARHAGLEVDVRGFGDPTG